MSTENAASGKKTGILWAASIVATALITLFTTVYVQDASIMNGGPSKMQKQALLADMRVSLARSAEKEKCAVLSTSDEESANYAEQSKTAARKVDRDMKRLEALIGKSNSAKEKELIAKFGKSWEEVQQIDDALLESAIQNTNLKALGLSNSIGAELAHKIDDNLLKLTAKVSPPAHKMQMDMIADDASLAIRNIALLQMRHIDAAADADKKKLEASMQAEQAKVSAALKTLDKMTAKKSRVYIREATTDFGEFMRVNNEIIRLSTLNTNNSTAALSLGKKRMAEAECDRTLEALQKLSAGKP
jgi:hypothetical protein